MTSISRVIPGLVERLEGSHKGVTGPDLKAEDSFTSLLMEFVNNVNGLQGESAQLQEAFMAGEPVELHQIMIKAEQAGLATDLLLEIRNKLLTAYNELIRMPL